MTATRARSGYLWKLETPEKVILLTSSNGLFYVKSKPIGSGPRYKTEMVTDDYNAALVEFGENAEIEAKTYALARKSGNPTRR